MNSVVPAPRNIKLILEFDGTDFHGWQSQPRERTVQDEVQAAIHRGLCEQEKLRVTGCSRTDAGVHARQYCANFFTIVKHSPQTIKGILNAMLPADISVLSVEDVPDDFCARRTASGKTYEYVILKTPEPRPLQARYCWHFHPRLDVARMREAAQPLAGTHDFTAFSGKLDPGKDPVRTLHSVDVRTHEERICIQVTGRSFLYRMVRIIVGTLLDAGRGMIEVDYVQDLLDTPDKSKMCVAAPAHGLTLVEVSYD